eukprot:TRINITY_DN5292_c0_g1_i4.p1 TRINITY_DN5292_c0_g1~~TRINITY_DN5292_c0_g1_i4.p1  ORF type:complete len:138 (-),score=32.57 TRINITY_DN5292_c0_g1_i4:641-1054(-)
MYNKKPKDLRGLVEARKIQMQLQDSEEQPQEVQKPQLQHFTLPPRKRLPERFEYSEATYESLLKRHQVLKQENVILANRVNELELETAFMRQELNEVYFHSRSGVRSLSDAVKKKKGPLEKQSVHLKVERCYLPPFT